MSGSRGYDGNFKIHFSCIGGRKAFPYAKRCLVHVGANIVAFHPVYWHLDPLPTKTVAKITFNQAAALKLKYIMFLSSKLNTNPQFPLEVCCAHARARLHMRAHGGCFIVTEFHQSSCGKNACDERTDNSPACKQASDSVEQAAAQTAPAYKKITFIVMASCPCTFHCPHFSCLYLFVTVTLI